MRIPTDDVIGEIANDLAYFETGRNIHFLSEEEQQYYYNQAYASLIDTED